MASSIAVKRINGSYGKVEIDNNEIFEIQQFESKLSITREDVMQSGSNAVDTKITSIKGTGTFTVNKINSRFKDYLDDFRTGKDPLFFLRLYIYDPDNGGREEISIKDCKFDGDFDLFSFTLGELMTQQFTFVFNHTNVINPSKIANFSI